MTALCRKIKAKLILQNLYTEYSLFDGFNQIPKLAPFWFKTGNLGTQRAQKQKREFKKPKREIGLKGNLKAKTGIYAKREFNTNLKSQNGKFA